MNKLYHYAIYHNILPIVIKKKHDMGMAIFCTHISIVSFLWCRIMSKFFTIALRKNFLFCCVDRFWSFRPQRSHLYWSQHSLFNYWHSNIRLCFSSFDVLLWFQCSSPWQFMSSITNIRKNWNFVCVMGFISSHITVIDIVPSKIDHTCSEDLSQMTFFCILK